MPVRVVTTRLDSGVAVYHDRGDLLDVLLASTALPGVFDPVRLADPTSGWQVPHVDGGLADLVPVAGARALAPTRVWVLDATVPTRIERVRSPLDALLAGLAESLRVRPAVDLGDIEVHHLTAPDLGVRMHDFRRTEEHIALGRASVAAALAGPADQVEPVAVPAAEAPVTGPAARSRRSGPSRRSPPDAGRSARGRARVRRRARAGCAAGGPAARARAPGGRPAARARRR